jgi:CRP-like cAMP-binding protein
MSGKDPLAEFERAVLREPENLRLRIDLAMALRRAGRAGDALAELRFVAIRYHRQGHWEQAIAVCQSLLEMDPSHDEIRSMLAELQSIANAPPRPEPAPAPRKQPPPPPPARAKTIPPVAAAPLAAEPPQRFPLAPPAADAVTPPPADPPRRPRATTMPERGRPLSQVTAGGPPASLPARAEGSVKTSPPRRPPTPFPDFAPPREHHEGPTPLPAPVPPTILPEGFPRRPLAALEEDVATDPGAAITAGAFGLASLLDEDQPLFPHGARDTVAGTSEARRKGPGTKSGPPPAPPRPATVPPRSAAPPPVAAPAPPPIVEEAITAETPAPPIRDEQQLLAMRRAFEGGFHETLHALGPDGSALEESLSLFRELPPDALHELSRRMLARRYAPGEVILREGDPGDACFVVNSGSVSVRKSDPNAIGPGADGTIEVVRLGQGVLFGEFALLHDRRRHATVTAVEPTEVFEIPRALLVELTQRFPEVGPALERLYRERLISNLLTTAPFFQPLPTEDRAGMMARFQPLRIEAGQTIVKQGERTGGFYLVMLGSVVISKRIAKHQRPLVTLREGAYFGEMSLLRGTTATATVTAEGATELAVLPPQDFYAIMAAYPVLWEELRREAKRREQITRHITGSGEQHWV